MIRHLEVQYLDGTKQILTVNRQSAWDELVEDELAVTPLIAMTPERVEAIKEAIEELRWKKFSHCQVIADKLESMLAEVKGEENVHS